MNLKITILTILILIGLRDYSLYGQEAISSTGGDATGSRGSVSYTVGQIVFNSLISSSGSIIQGVHQPYEISLVTAIENSNEITHDCKVYPNPTRGLIKLSIDYLDFDDMKYQLFDINGILLQDNKVDCEETDIIMDNLIPSTYILKVSKNKNEVKTFKIIKN